MALSILATITDMPDPSRGELGTAVMVDGALLGMALVICTLIVMFRRNPPLEGQFVEKTQHEADLTELKAERQRHEAEVKAEHLLLWGEIRSNQQAVAGITKTLEAQNITLHRIELKLDKTIDREIARAERNHHDT